MLAIAATGQRNQGAFELDLALPRLRLTKEAVGGEQLLLKATLRQPNGQPTNLSLSLPKLEGSASAISDRERSARRRRCPAGADIQGDRHGSGCGSVRGRQLPARTRRRESAGRAGDARRAAGPESVGERQPAGQRCGRLRAAARAGRSRRRVRPEHDQGEARRGGVFAARLPVRCRHRPARPDPLSDTAVCGCCTGTRARCCAWRSRAAH